MERKLIVFFMILVSFLVVTPAFAEGADEQINVTSLVTPQNVDFKI